MMDPSPSQSRRNINVLICVEQKHTCFISTSCSIGQSIVSEVAPSTLHGKIPGPPGIPLLGNLLEFVHNPLSSLMDGASVYGDLVRFQLGPLAVYLLNH